MTGNLRWAASCILGVCGIALGAGAESDRLPPAGQRLLRAYPGVRFYQSGQRITRVYGVPFGFGDSPEAAAQEFVRNHAGLFGVPAEDLAPYGPLADRRHVQPVKYRRDSGRYDFTLVYYSQLRDGIPVFRAELRLLVRNEPGYPLVWAASSLRPLGAFRPAARLIDSGAGKQQALAQVPGLVNFTRPELVIWAGLGDRPAPPTTALRFIADNGLPASAAYQKWLFLADAASGRILYRQNLILHTDVVGNVSGYATQGLGADICGPEELTPMPYARVAIVGGNYAYADQNGDFVIANSGDQQVTVRSRVRGRWFIVHNYAGSDSVLEQDVVPPGPANFEHNAGGGQYTTAEVNGYVQANVVRDFVLTYNPNFPVIANQTNFPVNVNINSTCNAYYDYASINFFRAGGGCPNTAFSTVVHHEYGHHVVSSGGSGQGAYGEGMGDVMGVLITDDPGLAYGFFGDCNQPLRNADNNKQYPCYGEAHECGKLLSGCVWSTRNELAASYPDDYIDILANLTINSVLLHTGESITPQITIDFLTLDDDDGDIGNGTPHYPEICAGFGAHNMDCPELELLDFEYPDGLPELLTPGQPTTIRVNVLPLNADPQPGSGKVFYRVDGGAFQQGVMNELEPNQYEATLPPASCGALVEYYFSAETTGGDVVSDPPDAPASSFSARAAFGTLVALDEPLDSSPGWSVQGLWAFGQPTGGGGQYGGPDPTSGYTGPNVYGYNLYGDYENYLPQRHLTSTAIDCSGLSGVRLAFWRWLGVEQPAYDHAYVRVSNNGSAWTTVWENDREITDYSWAYQEFDLSAVADDQPTVYLRWTMGPTDGGWRYCGWNIDDVQLLADDCNPPCPGDIDGDLDTDQADLGLLLSDWGCSGGDCIGDLDGDGDTDESDLGILLSDWGCVP